MKLLIVLLTLVLSLSSCQKPDAVAVTEVVPADYGAGIELAKEEFDRIFSEFTDLQITETVTASRTDDSGTYIVQITYSSENGDGVYGFVIGKNENGDTEILSHGEDVTVDNLLN
ncbi:MAG: hypothetical protein IJD13_07130 [Oscillospiraceae bacterium]|nr:hypothetical protein [Oscillospiraceae bacterium]